MSCLHRSALALLLLIAAPGPGLAQGATLAELSGDFGGAAPQARAVLVGHGDRVDLLIFETAPNGAERLAVRARGVAWTGEVFGTRPSLARAPAGGFMVRSENTSMGRNRWRETLTVAYRRGAYLIAGYTYWERDTLSRRAPFSCDVNLLTGRAVVMGRRMRTHTRAKPIAQWRRSDSPPVCIPGAP